MNRTTFSPDEVHVSDRIYSTTLSCVCATISHEFREGCLMNKSAKCHVPPVGGYCATGRASKEWWYVRQLDSIVSLG